MNETATFSDARPLAPPEACALVEAQAEALWAMQRPDGHIVFELEADCTIPAEYVLLRHFLGEIDPPREARIARYLARAAERRRLLAAVPCAAPATSRRASRPIGR